jgi:hypothetical protein
LAALFGNPRCLAAQTPNASAIGEDRIVTANQKVAPDDANSRFVGALAASFRLLMMEHAGRVAFQDKTRRELDGPFFRDYVRSVKTPQTWQDGDGWFVNYIGHPIHGAAAGRAWLVHHPEDALDIGLSKRYWSSRAKAAQWAAFYSLQFEFGPLSEASIGNVGLRPNTTGWVDHLVTPAGAFVIMVAEDAVDSCFVRLVERHTRNRALRGTARVVLNPSRALANVVDGKTPWFRTRGPLDIR